MKINFARSAITPSLERPVYLAGFHRNRRADAVQGELEVCALSLTDDGGSIVLVALDLIGFFQTDVADVVARVRQQAGESCEILIASTHTHHAPDSLGLWGPTELQSGVDPQYMEQVKATVVATVLDAARGPHVNVTACIPVTVRVPGLVKNTRDPAIVDDELAILRFQGPGGRAIAYLCDFPCHPEVVIDSNTTMTADYAGYLRREIEALTGAPCIFFAGALGGMLTPDAKDHSFEECRAMGHQLAQAGLRAIEAAQDHPRPTCDVSFRRAHIRVPLENEMFKMAFTLGILPDTRNDADEVETSVSLLKIGGMWLAGVPGELLPKLGLILKDEMLRAGANAAAIIGLADDEIGYILPAEDYTRPADWLDPGDQYEESVSLGPAAGPAVVAGVRSLLS